MPVLSYPSHTTYWGSFSAPQMLHLGLTACPTPKSNPTYLGFLNVMTTASPWLPWLRSVREHRAADTRLCRADTLRDTPVGSSTSGGKPESYFYLTSVLPACLGDPRTEEHGSPVLQGKEQQKHHTFSLQYRELGTHGQSK